MTEKKVIELFSSGFSLPPESHRARLLDDCLSVLGSDKDLELFSDMRELDDEQMELIAAAGDQFAREYLDGTTLA